MTYLIDIKNFLSSKKFLFDYKKFGDFSENLELCPESLRNNSKKIQSFYWIKDSNEKSLPELKLGHIILSNKIDLSNLHKDFCGSVFVVENPRYVFNKIIGEFFVNDTSFVSNNFGNNIGIGTIIEDGVVIGSGTTIGYNNVIKSNTIIGNNVKIGSNNTIGGVGFGYQMNEEGIYEVIYHIGGVKIEDNVEIGNNNCIDKAVMGYTHLKKNCKIDNLVHIAHGVEIGENSLIIANSMIAGSTVVGDSCWVAPSSSILNNTYFGSNSMCGMGSVIIKNVENNSLVVGVPAKKIKNL